VDLRVIILRITRKSEKIKEKPRQVDNIIYLIF